jgi:hypothetical protein
MTAWEMILGCGKMREDYRTLAPEFIENSGFAIPGTEKCGRENQGDQGTHSYFYMKLYIDS